jgi:two-component system cell cycle response regulator CtrA
MTRVLLIEDDAASAASTELDLAADGIICDRVEYGLEGVDMAKIYDYDMILLDLMLSDIDGYEVLLRLRSLKINIPVLILSGLTSTDQKIKGLGYGADDYLTKPFNSGELIARIKAIVRRSKGHSESVIRFDKVAINLDTRKVEVDGKSVQLTNKEYAILELLVMRKGTVITKEMFLNHLYGGVEEPAMKIVDVFVCKLRKKLADKAGGTNYIETVWGRGYMLKDFDFSSDNDEMSEEDDREAVDYSFDFLDDEVIEN